MWSTAESYLSLKAVVVLIGVVNDSAERSLGLVTDNQIDRITRSEEQTFHLYQVLTELRSRMKKIREKEELSKKLRKLMNYLF